MVVPSVGRRTAMCAEPANGRNEAIRNGMNVSGLGELSWKTDVFGVLGEFRSEFRSASAPLAQSVEQRTFNPQVLGSSPRGRTHDEERRIA